MNSFCSFILIILIVYGSSLKYFYIDLDDNTYKELKKSPFNVDNILDSIKTKILQTSEDSLSQIETQSYFKMIINSNLALEFFKTNFSIINKFGWWMKQLPISQLNKSLQTLIKNQIVLMKLLQKVIGIEDQVSLIQFFLNNGTQITKIQLTKFITLKTIENRRCLFRRNLAIRVLPLDSNLTLQQKVQLGKTILLMKQARFQIFGIDLI